MSCKLSPHSPKLSPYYPKLSHALFTLTHSLLELALSPSAQFNPPTLHLPLQYRGRRRGVESVYRRVRAICKLLPCFSTCFQNLPHLVQCSLILLHFMYCSKEVLVVNAALVSCISFSPNICIENVVFTPLLKVGSQYDISPLFRFVSSVPFRFVLSQPLDYAHNVALCTYVRK